MHLNNCSDDFFNGANNTSVYFSRILLWPIRRITHRIIGEIVGAVIVFLYGRYLFKAYILKQFGERFKKFKDGFNRNSLSYLLYIRVIGGVPFGIQNLLAAVLDMKFRDYFIATIFGVIPWAYILVSIGNGIQNIMETQNFSSSDILKIEYLLPVLLISIIVIVPVIYKFIKKDFWFDYKKITYNQLICAGGSAG